jgi:two-component system, chemotaxis family, sensor histidine kinase and response regulator PixL
MAIDPDIRDQAYQFFVEEAPELLQILETGLLSLRQERSTAKVHDLMRAAHSIKGGAASVGLEAIATLAHRLEAIFRVLYNDTLEIDADLESQLLQSFDCLRLPLMEQIKTGAFDSETALAIADPIFTQLEEHFGETLTRAADSYLPSSTDLGIDMISAIFEVDIAQGLDHLANVVDHPQAYEVAGELRAQVEVFEGFSEFLNLPGFGAIAKTVIQALNAYPDRALDIARLALTDFECSRQAILNGDRSHNVGPSDILAALAEVASVSSQEMQLPTELEETPEDIERVLSLLQNTFGNTIGNANSNTIGNTNSVAENIAESSQTGSYSDVSEVIDNFDTLHPHYFDELNSPDILETLAESVQSIEQELELLPQDHFSSTFQPESNPVDPELARSQMGRLVRFDQPADGTLQVSQFTELVPAPDSSSQDSIYGEQIEPVTPRNLTVRVDAERLERINNLVGELSINRDGLSLQSDQLQGTLKELLERFSQFQKMVRHLGKLSDQMLITPEQRPRHQPESEQQEGSSNSTFTGSNHAVSPSFASSQFDPLEMDNYGALQFQVQEILESMMQMEETIEDITLFSKQPHQMLIQQRRMLTQLRDEVMQARMLPLGEVLNRFHRVLRDLSATHHKPVRLTLIGTDVLVEKAILEKLYDPLLHLLRNAFDHGVESREIRQQRNKSEQGEIEIRAYHKGNQTIIEVKDDGQGLNFEEIQKRVLELGWLTPEQLAATPLHRLGELIFEPGFSTARQVNKLSGRGVGLDVVRSQLKSIKGTVTVSSSSEKGATFTLRLPSTLTIANLVICLVGTAVVALPTDSVEEILTPNLGEIRQSGTQRFLYWQEKIVPIHQLSNLLDYGCPLPDAPSKSLVFVPSPKNWALPLLILRQEQQVFALEVDSLVTEQELIIKPFSPTLTPPPYIYGCTILADGSLVPVMDGTALLSLSQKQSRTQNRTQSRTAIALPSQPESPDASEDQASFFDQHAAAIKASQTPTVLIVDDSASLRRTLAHALKRAGFRVLQAQDGSEAIDQLQQSMPVELVICDIEMPNMNGFEFLNYRRQDPQLSAIPIVMLTSRSNEKHRWLAMQLGAAAYFTKPYLEQEILTALKNIIDSTVHS